MPAQSQAQINARNFFPIWEVVGQSLEATQNDRRPLSYLANDGANSSRGIQRSPKMGMAAQVSTTNDDEQFFNHEPQTFCLHGPFLAQEEDAYRTVLSNTPRSTPSLP